MHKSTPRYGIRNRLASHKESWHHGTLADTAAIHEERLQQSLQVIAIGRFLLSRKEAKNTKIDNPLVDVSRSLESQNRHRGVAITAGRIMLQYQTPKEFYDRVAASSQRRNIKYLTEKGQLDYMMDLKQKIAATFRGQQNAEAATIDDQMRRENMRQLEKERIWAAEQRPHLLSSFDDTDELSSLFLDERGAHEYTGPIKEGFSLRSRVFYDDLSVGVKVSTANKQTGAQIQYDLDRINSAYQRYGLISGEHGELKFDERLSLFVPLFIANSDNAVDELYLPIVPRESIPFQELSIHKIQ